jgi:Lon protease-like protein
MTLPLHIFEPRYREMINWCTHESQPFGVVLIDSGPEVGGPAQPHPIGTYGSVSRLERLPDGRMNIEVIGQERFRIHELHHDKDYLTGTVEKFPLAAQDDHQALECAQQLSPWINRYLKLLGQVADISFDKQEMPISPVALAYFSAIIVQVPMAEKQLLLNCASAEEMLERERSLYRREISLIRAMLDSPQANHNADFSPN